MNDQDLLNQDKPKNFILITGMALAVLLPLSMIFLRRYPHIDYTEKIYYSLVIDWVTVLILWLYAYKIERNSLLIWTGGDTGVGFTIVSVLVLYMLYVLVVVISSIPWWFGYRENGRLATEILRLLRGHPILIFFISITAGVTEEITIRGYLLTRLSMYFKGYYVPVIISSAIFSALHYSYHSLSEFIFTFLLGIVCSVYYIRYRNIHALIIVHFLIDFIVFNSAHNTFY
jgi:membrane protease YdiL (CAAX protease family)